MENKNTITDAKIGSLNELTKVLSVKEQAQYQLYSSCWCVDIIKSSRISSLKKFRVIF